MSEHKTIYLPHESERHQAIAEEKQAQRREAARLFEMAYRLDAEAVQLQHEADRIRARAQELEVLAKSEGHFES